MNKRLQCVIKIHSGWEADEEEQEKEWGREGGGEKEEPLSLLVVSKQWPNNSPKWSILFPQLKVSSTCLFQVLTYNQSTINKGQQCHRWKWVVVLIITEGRRRVEWRRGKREGEEGGGISC